MDEQLMLLLFLGGQSGSRGLQSGGADFVGASLFRMMHEQNLFFIVKEGSLLTRVYMKLFCDIATKFVKKNNVHAFLKQYVHVHLFWCFYITCSERDL